LMATANLFTAINQYTDAIALEIDRLWAHTPFRLTAEG
jgi:hypothetical protein